MQAAWSGVNVPCRCIAAAVAATLTVSPSRPRRKLLWCKDVCQNWEELYDRYAERMRRDAQPPKRCPNAAAVASVLERHAAYTEAVIPRVSGRWRDRHGAEFDGSVVIVGTNHVSSASVSRVRKVARELGPTSLVLELCEERFLPYLCCPREHLVAWNTATLPKSREPPTAVFLPRHINGVPVLFDEESSNTFAVPAPSHLRRKKSFRVSSELLATPSQGLGYRASKNASDRHPSREFAPFGAVVEGHDEGDGWVKVPWDEDRFGLLDQFELDQMWVGALQQGAEVYEALDAVRAASDGRPILVALADVATSQQRDMRDPARDELLAHACMASVLLGHKVVLLVVGESHVEPIVNELLRCSVTNDPMDATGDEQCAQGVATRAITSIDTFSAQPHTDHSKSTYPIFFSTSGLEAVLGRREMLRTVISPQDVRHSLEKFMANLGLHGDYSKLFGSDVSSPLHDFALKAGLHNASGFVVEVEGLHEARSFLSELEELGGALRARSVDELRSWWCCAGDRDCEAQVPTSVTQPSCVSTS